MKTFLTLFAGILCSQVALADTYALKNFQCVGVSAQKQNVVVGGELEPFTQTLANALTVTIDGQPDRAGDYVAQNFFVDFTFNEPIVAIRSHNDGLEEVVLVRYFGRGDLRNVMKLKSVEGQGEISTRSFTCKFY